MEAPQPVPISSATSLEFGYLANSLAQLLEVARREIERDREAAKASLATASSILQSEIERRSGVRPSRTAGLAGWQVSRVRAFIEKNLHRTIHTQDQRRGAAEPGALLAVVQADLRRTSACLRREAAAGESLPFDDNQFRVTERHSAERRIF